MLQSYHFIFEQNLLLYLNACCFNILPRRSWDGGFCSAEPIWSGVKRLAAVWAPIFHTLCWLCSWVFSWEVVTFLFCVFCATYLCLALASFCNINGPCSGVCMQCCWLCEGLLLGMPHQEWKLSLALQRLFVLSGVMFWEIPECLLIFLFSLAK